MYREYRVRQSKDSDSLMVSYLASTLRKFRNAPLKINLTINLENYNKL